MYLGDLRNFSLDINPKLADLYENWAKLSYVVKSFEDNFFYDSNKIKDHEILTTDKDLHYLKSLGFESVNQSHFINRLTSQFNKNNFSFTKFCEEFITQPDLVYQRNKNGFIEEISFKKSYCNTNQNISYKLYTKSKFYPSGKFLRDNSKSFIIFNQFNFLFKTPYAIVKFNKSGVSFNFYNCSKNKFDTKKTTYKLKFLDCLIARYITQPIYFKFFDKDLEYNYLINLIPRLKKYKFNSKTDLFSLLTEEEILLINMVLY
jgi:hypothetical protein